MCGRGGSSKLQPSTCGQPLVLRSNCCCCTTSHLLCRAVQPSRALHWMVRTTDDGRVEKSRVRARQLGELPPAGLAGRSVLVAGTSRLASGSGSAPPVTQPGCLGPAAAHCADRDLTRTLSHQRGIFPPPFLLFCTGVSALLTAMCCRVVPSHSSRSFFPIANCQSTGK